MAGFSNDERVFFNALVQMSKSIEKIASELADIKKLLFEDNRRKMNESRRRQNQEVRQMVTEAARGNLTKKQSRLDKNTPEDNIRSIMNGDYL